VRSRRRDDRQHVASKARREGCKNARSSHPHRTLGGLFLFGPIGFIIGPLVCGLFLTVWEIYGATFKDVLPPVGQLVIGQIKKADANLSTSEESEGKTP